MSEFTGGCLCGAVRYEGSDVQFGGDCYCTDCRKSSGTSHGSFMFMPADKLSVTGELTSFERHADSGNTVTAHFCPTCGSHIHEFNSAMPGMAVLLASTLDDPEVYRPVVTVYTSRAPSWSRSSRPA